MDEKKFAAILCAKNKNEYYHIIQLLNTLIIPDGYKLEDFDILKHIKSNCPPVYIWHCKNDPLVPFATFEATVRKLEELNIPHETRVYEEGGHGLQSEHKAEEDDWITPVADYFRRTIR